MPLVLVCFFECSNPSLELVEALILYRLGSPSEIYIGSWPTVTDPPQVIHGEVKY